MGAIDLVFYYNKMLAILTKYVKFLHILQKYLIISRNKQLRERVSQVKQTRLIVDENSIKEFVLHIAAGGAEPHTQKRYEHDVKMFADFLGKRKISQKILEDYKTAKLEEYSAATVKTMLFGLNKYLEFIGSELRINNKDLSAHREKTPDEQLTMDEYLRVLSALKSCQDDRLYVIVETICSAGIKYSELKYLTVEAIEAGLLILPYGVRKNRNVYLPKNLCADLRKFCADNGVYHGSIFLTKLGNFPDRGNMTGAIREACKNTGIDHKKLSMRAFKDFYTANFENIRSEMAELIDEDLRILHTPSFAVSNENSFRSFALKWLGSSENGLTEATKSKYSRICEKYIFPVLGNTDCRRITRNHADSVIEKIYDMPLKTRADIMRVMWLTLDFARETGLKIRVSQRNLCTVKNRGVALRILADDETEKLVKYLKSDSSTMCAGIYLAFNTGIRAEELCALKCGDIDLGRRTLRVSNDRTSQMYLSEKADGYFSVNSESTLENNLESVRDSAKRVIYLPEFLVDFLRPIYEKMKADCYLINGFPNRAYEVSAVENKVKKIAAKCGFFDVDFAAVRDTFGARCAENNLDMKMLGEIMGSNNVDIYYPNVGAAESPLEFLREAY